MNDTDKADLLIRYTEWLARYGIISPHLEHIGLFMEQNR
jgi:hypothetical protein